MSTIEDRLTRALAARADLVQPEDLRATPPGGPQPSLLRRPATYLLAAAACAAAVALPFVVDGDGSDRPSPPPATQTPQPTPPAEVRGADWPEVRSFDKYDVDGDGERDRVVTRTESGENLTQDPWRVEARLSSGGTYAVLLDRGGWDINLIGPVDLDGDGGDEILYYNGLEAEAESEEIGVLDLEGPGLVDLPVPADPGITSQNDDRGRLRAWWLDDRALYSSRSVEGGYVPGDHTTKHPDEYAVDVWQWTLVDGALVPREMARQCVRSLAIDQPYSCDEGPGPPPGTQPAVTDSAYVAEPVDLDVDGDGADDLVTLEGPEGKDMVEDGDVLLVVSLGGGGELRAPVPAGWTPDVFTTPYVGPDGTRGLVVRQEGGDATALTLYLVRGDELVTAEPEGEIRFGNGFDGPEVDTTRTDTWLTTEGRLFSRTTPADQIEDDTYQFFEWTLRGTRIMAEETLGFGCWEC